MAASTRFNFEQYVKDRRALVDSRLAAYLSGNDPPLLWEAMRYTVSSGGKRLRALLCLTSAQACAGQAALEAALPCACAIELVHAFSLIHDDLPAMDNDDLRRGRPSNHKVFGEDMAILAGDALFALAMEILLTAGEPPVPAPVLLAVVGELARASGSHGMVGGQVADLTLTGTTGAGQPGLTGVTSIQLEAMHRRKTGALIRFSVWSGAMLAGAGSQQIDVLSSFGETLGLAFQIADDLLDVTGNIEMLGKTPGKDARSGKATWVRVLGVDSARDRLSELLNEGKQMLGRIKLEADAAFALESLLNYAVFRSS